MTLTPNQAAEIHFKKIRSDDARYRRMARAADHIETIIDNKLRGGDFKEDNGNFIIDFSASADSFGIIPAAEAVELETLVSIKYAFAGWKQVTIAFHLSEDHRNIHTVIKLFKPDPIREVPLHADLMGLMRIGGFDRADKRREPNPIVSQEEIQRQVNELIKNAPRIDKSFNGS